MKITENIGGVDVSYNPDCRSALTFMATFRQVCESRDELTTRWVQYLKALGVKAARPDDGWVDRVNNTVHVDCYPFFYLPLQAGDTIALGWPEQYRLVKLVKRIEYRFSPMPMNVWKFE